MGVDRMARNGPHPGRRRAVRCPSGNGGEHLLTLALAESPPDAVGLVNLQGMPPARDQRGTTRADRLGLGLAAGAGRAAFTLGMEEVGAGHTATCRLQLPVPQIGVGTRKASRVGHVVHLLDRFGPVPRTSPTKGGTTPGTVDGCRPVRRCRHVRRHPSGCPCSHRICVDAGAAVDLTIDRDAGMIKCAPEPRCRGCRTSLDRASREPQRAHVGRPSGGPSPAGIPIVGNHIVRWVTPRNQTATVCNAARPVRQPASAENVRSDRDAGIRRSTGSYRIEGRTVVIDQRGR